MSPSEQRLPRVIPVIDLLGGIVVRGVAGNRSAYQPLQSRITSSTAPPQVALDLVTATSASVLYVADLDAIQTGTRSIDCYQQIAASGARLWLDAGITSSAVAEELFASLEDRKIAADLVIGLESISTLEEFHQLARFNQSVASSRSIFSLDLRHGLPLTTIDAWQKLSPQEIAQHATKAGFSRLILLDLAGVGVGGGIPTLSLAHELRKTCAAPVELIVGGGVRSTSDLYEAAGACADGVLVASALHSRAIDLQTVTK